MQWRGQRFCSAGSQRGSGAEPPAGSRQGGYPLVVYPKYYSLLLYKSREWPWRRVGGSTPNSPRGLADPVYALPTSTANADKATYTGCGYHNVYQVLYKLCALVPGSLNGTIQETIHQHAQSTFSIGATENARPDIARPSKLWGLTSRDWTN